MSDSDITRTLEFMSKGFPNPKSKNKHTQLGVHFEEIGEMVEAIEPLNEDAQRLLDRVFESISELTIYLKENDNVVTVLNKEEFLDALCDQLVTSTGVAYVYGMDIEGAFGEVNRSNLSKFDNNGEPIFDKNLKLIKGPNYIKAKLAPYI